jgi:hypothetical protein
MIPMKIVALVSGITLLAFVAGLSGPGPLVPGLGPGFDQLGAKPQRAANNFHLLLKRGPTLPGAVRAAVGF